MMKIYEKIRKLREDLGMSQEELALKVGFKTRSSVTKIEQGQRDLSQSQVVLFAKALNTTPEYLLGWEEKDDKKELFPSPLDDEEYIWIARNAKKLSGDQKSQLKDVMKVLFKIKDEPEDTSDDF